MSCQTFQEFKAILSRPPQEPTVPIPASGLRCSIVEQLSEVDIDSWNALVNGDTLYLHSDYLRAMEASSSDELSYRYVRFYEESRLVGVAAFQLTAFETGDISSNFASSNTVVKWATKWLRRDSTFLRFNLLVCGNAFSTGEHGFRFCPSVSAEDTFRALHEAIERIKADCKSHGERISAIIVKDFYPPSYQFARQFRLHHYGQFEVDPNMMMPIRPEWKSFNDYLDALNSKFRTKARGALKKSRELSIRRLTLEDFRTHRAEFERLYDQVYSRAGFRLGKLTPEAFENYFRMPGDKYFMFGYFLEDNMVGFQSGFEYDRVLDAHFVGLDYDYNHQYAVYPTMLYEYIREAIARGCTRVAFGRTAMEIKSTVGAFPVDLKLYIRHRSTASNTLLRILFSYIKPSEYSLRNPYKKDELEVLETFELP